MSVGIQKQEHFMQRRRGDEGGKAMETHIALVWTKASISHCEQMNMKLGIMDGRRLYSIICLPLSTIERLTNHEKEVQKKIFCETLAPICHCELPESKLQLLPSSSSSDVIDFERIDRAVVGALFGGGGAEQRETDMWPKAGRSSAVIWRRHTFSGKSLIDQSNFTEGKGSN